MTFEELKTDLILLGFERAYKDTETSNVFKRNHIFVSYHGDIIRVVSYVTFSSKVFTDAVPALERVLGLLEEHKQRISDDVQRIGDCSHSSRI